MIVSWHCFVGMSTWLANNGLAGAWFVATFDRATGESGSTILWLGKLLFIFIFMKQTIYKKSEIK